MGTINILLNAFMGFILARTELLLKVHSPNYLCMDEKLQNYIYSLFLLFSRIFKNRIYLYVIPHKTTLGKVSVNYKNKLGSHQPPVHSFTHAHLSLCIVAITSSLPFVIKECLFYFVFKWHWSFGNTLM